MKTLAFTGTGNMSREIMRGLERRGMRGARAAE